MQKKFYLYFPLFTLVILGTTLMFAQKPVKPATTSSSNSKKPFAKTFLGEVTGTLSMKTDQANQLITQPLKIIDDKKVPYVISSYQFSYKRIGVTEDEATGKTALQSDIVADRFTTTPLPAVWQKNIIEGLHTGEELYFFDIIVFDKHGRRFFAPELKITIQ